MDPGPNPGQPPSEPPEAEVPMPASQSDDRLTFMILGGILALIALVAGIAFFVLGFGRP